MFYVDHTSTSKDHCRRLGFFSCRVGSNFTSFSPSLDPVRSPVELASIENSKSFDKLLIAKFYFLNIS